MSWGPALYAQIADAEAMASIAAALGIEMLADGTPSTGNHNFALVPMSAPWSTPPLLDGEGEVVTPGVRLPGLWFMGRINDDWPGAGAAMAILQAADVLRILVDPPTVWAGG